MALKISPNCTVYKEQKRAVKVAEWREKGLVVKSDDFLLRDYDFQKMCDNAKNRYLKMISSVTPAYQYPQTTINNNGEWILPLVLLGGAIVIGYMIFT